MKQLQRYPRKAPARVLTITVTLTALVLFAGACKAQPDIANQPGAVDPGGPIGAIPPALAEVPSTVESQADPAPTAMPEQATPVAVSLDLGAQPPSGDLLDLLYQASVASSQQPRQGLKTEMYDADGGLTFSQTVEYIRPDRFRRLQGIGDQWMDAITIGEVNYVRTPQSDWVKSDFADPVADMAGEVFGDPPESKEALQALSTQALSELGFTELTFDITYEGLDTIDGQPMWVLAHTVLSAGMVVETGKAWIGVNDGLVYRTESRMNPDALAQAGPEIAQIAQSMGNTVITRYYDFQLEAPIP